VKGEGIGSATQGATETGRPAKSPNKLKNVSGLAKGDRGDKRVVPATDIIKEIMPKDGRRGEAKIGVTNQRRIKTVGIGGK